MNRSNVRSPAVRLGIAATISLLVAAFLLVVEPFPTNVLGQTTPSDGETVDPGETQVLGPQVTVINQGGQPVNITVNGNTFILVGAPGVSIVVTGATCTGLTTNVVTCTVAPNTEMTIITSLTTAARPPQSLIAAPVSAALPAEPVAGAAAGARNPAPTIPVTLPRTGHGAEPRNPIDSATAGVFALVVVAAACAGGVLRHARRSGP